MGQKTNQSIFRLGVYNNEWDYKYFEKNVEESSLILYKNFEILKYITNTFKKYNILVYNLKTEYNQTSIHISFSIFNLEPNSYVIKQSTTKKLVSNIITNLISPGVNTYIKNKKIKIKIKKINKLFEDKMVNNLVKKNIRHFKKFLKNKFHKNLIKILFIASKENNTAKLVSDYMSICINKQRKKHYYLLFVLKKFFQLAVNSPDFIIKGVKIEISGRLNGAPRAKARKLQIGSTPLQSFNSKVSYHNSTSYTSNGSFGIKVWMCEK